MLTEDMEIFDVLTSMNSDARRLQGNAREERVEPKTGGNANQRETMYRVFRK